MSLASPARADLVDPAVLAALGGLEVRARWLVDGFLTGLHRSPRKGFSVEFAEHRPYQPGDDLRYLDWRTLARTDRWVVKQFEEETNLRALLLVDGSRSMAWRSAGAGLTKRAYAEQLAAALALLLLKQRDAVGIVRFDETVTARVAPRARAAHFQRIMAVLAAEPGGRDSRLDLALREAAALVRRPGLVIVLSDLLCDPGPVKAALRAVRAAGHDVLVLHILDPGERELPDAPPDARFVDSESGVEIAADAHAVRGRYRAAAAAALAEWQRLFLEQGARYALCGTEAPFGLALRRAFAAREALRT
ncbi:MAG: DUF58 domain-containing protein [Gemmatimonadaceae bacterium]|jgi:uncharacterized protein (DUF58 family)|nr:DUF58 domain-containing protein [Gemmatimonadaceae bacterium]